MIAMVDNVVEPQLKSHSQKIRRLEQHRQLQHYPSTTAVCDSLELEPRLTLLSPHLNAVCDNPLDPEQEIDPRFDSVLDSQDLQQDSYDLDGLMPRFDTLRNSLDLELELAPHLDAARDLNQDSNDLDGLCFDVAGNVLDPERESTPHFDLVRDPIHLEQDSNGHGHRFDAIRDPLDLEQDLNNLGNPTSLSSCSVLVRDPLDLEQRSDDLDGLAPVIPYASFHFGTVALSQVVQLQAQCRGVLTRRSVTQPNPSEYIHVFFQVYYRGVNFKQYLK